MTIINLVQVFFQVPKLCCAIPGACYYFGAIRGKCNCFYLNRMSFKFFNFISIQIQEDCVTCACPDKYIIPVRRKNHVIDFSRKSCKCPDKFTIQIQEFHCFITRSGKNSLSIRRKSDGINMIQMFS